MLYVWHKCCYNISDGYSLSKKEYNSVSNLRRNEKMSLHLEQEQIVFEIISYAGEARSNSFEAIRAARAGDFSTAEKAIASADEVLKKVHQIQTNLITKEVNGEATACTLLMSHAQDHLMTAMLARDLIREMIEQYRCIEELKKQ